MRRTISLIVLLLVFSPLTVSAERTSVKEETSFFAGLFENGLFGNSSEKRRVADDRDFDIDKGTGTTTQPEPFLVAEHTTHKGATFPLREFPPDPIDPVEEQTKRMLKDFFFQESKIKEEPKKQYDEGATFPLQPYPREPLPDCSEFIDPKDAAKYSHCHGVVDTSKKWLGYLEFMGKPGTARNLGQSDLFVPLN